MNASQTRMEMPELPIRVDDPVFEVEKGAKRAGDEDFGEQLHRAKEQLQQLKQQQDEVERRKQELEELQTMQLRYVKGRADMIKNLEQALSQLDRETFRSKKRLEMLAEAKENFTKLLERIEVRKPERWPREDIRRELDLAQEMLDESGQDYREAMATLDLDGADGDARDRQRGAIGGGTAPDMGYWMRVGLALALPLAGVGGLVALLLRLLP